MCCISELGLWFSLSWLIGHSSELLASLQHLIDGCLCGHFKPIYVNAKKNVVLSYTGHRKIDLWMVMYLWFSEVQDVLYYSFALVSEKMGWKGCSNSNQKTFRKELTVKKFNLNSAIFTCLLFSAGVKIFLSFTLMAWCNEWIHCLPTEWLSCCFICLVVNATNYEDF